LFGGIVLGAEPLADFSQPWGASQDVTAFGLGSANAVEMLVDLVRVGLATAKAERVVAGGPAIEVARVRITEAGRRALTNFGG
jgi:hypothetical protein